MLHHCERGSSVGVRIEVGTVDRAVWTICCHGAAAVQALLDPYVAVPFADVVLDLVSNVAGRRAVGVHINVGCFSGFAAE